MAKSQERSYDGSPDRAYQAALQAVGKLGYRILNSDSSARSVSFNTGMSMRSWAGQDVTAMAVSDGPDRTKLIVGGGIAKGGIPFGGGSQVASWGELGKVTRTFYEAFERILPNVEEPPKDAPPEAGSMVSEEIANLAKLHREGALSDEEFSAAKARLLS